MSVAIGIHAGRYIVFAADCLASDYNEEMTKVEKQCIETKIHGTPLGLITGTGSAELLRSVAHRIIDAPPTSTQGLIDVISEERNNVADDPDIPATLKDHALKLTGWMLSSRGRIEGSVIGLQLYVWHAGGVHGFLPPGAVLPLVPILPADGENTFGAENRTRALLENGRHTCSPEDTDATVAASIEQHISLLRSVIAACAGEHDTVSAECQIGLHLEGGETLVSEILAPGDPVTWQESEDE